MDDYRDNFFEQEIRIGQMIYEKFKTLYRETEALEKKAARELGEDHPITEELGTQSVHKMNGDFRIEEILNSKVPGYRRAKPNIYRVKESLHVNAPRCGKLKPETLKQAFQVLESIKWSGARSRPEIRNELNNAAKLTAKAYGIERNTVADIWVRRLGLGKKTAGFISLLKDWRAGDASGLKRVLKRHTDSSLHGLIDAFFKKKGT
jgi:hypothetical protein